MSALNEQISRMKAHGDIDLATPSEFSISSTLEKMPVGELVSCLLHSLSNALRGADSESKAYHSLEPATIAIVGREMPFHIIDSDILQILRQKLSGIEVETKEKFSLEKYLQTLH